MGEFSILSADFSTLLLSSVLAVTGLTLYLQWVTYKRFPAGPWGLPIVGYLPFVGPRLHETLIQLGERYGNVYSMRLGHEIVIVLNDWEAIRESLVKQSDNFSGRPSIFVFDSKIHKTDIATNDGPVWKEQRRFAIQALKPFSTGKLVRESIVMESIETLLKHLENNIGNILEMEDIFFLPIFNIVWRMASGRVLSETDERTKAFCDIVKANFIGLRNNSPLNYLPWLRFLVPGGCGHWKHLHNHKLLYDYLEIEVKQHLKNFKDNECRDFTDAYIDAIKKQETLKQTQEPPFNMDHLFGTLYDLFLGGVETSVNTLTWGFLFLSLWPHVQKKVQAELKEVIGSSRLPTLEDQPRLPYLEATILEIHRFSSLMPLSFLHSTHKSTTILGHPIPKGATIIQNIYSVHRDPKLWKDPEVFRPERFLDANHKVVKPDYLIPFSVGARICPGEAIAKIQLFLIFGCLLQKFTFENPPDTALPSLDPRIALTLVPKPYSLLIGSVA